MSKNFSGTKIIGLISLGCSKAPRIPIRKYILRRMS